MEKFYIVTNEKYLDALKRFSEVAEKQRMFIKKISEEYGIEGNRYTLGGDGCMNCAFDDYGKKTIRLSIEATYCNIDKLSTQLVTKKDRYEDCTLIAFRKNSKIMKQIQQRCIDEQVPINLCRPRLGDYLGGTLMYGGFSYSQFEHDGNVYVQISVNNIPDNVYGFNEISGSEFYKAKEDCEVNS